MLSGELASTEEFRYQVVAVEDAPGLFVKRFAATGLLSLAHKVVGIQ